jgi:hypothetical protein
MAIKQSQKKTRDGALGGKTTNGTMQSATTIKLRNQNNFRFGFNCINWALPFGREIP